MKKYLIVAALILCAPQPILAQAEGFPARQYDQAVPGHAR